MAVKPPGAVARNVLMSILGFVWPVALLAVSTPIVFHGLGEAGFGVWSLVGNVIGYLGAFNSLQTAGTKYLAEYLATDDRVAIRHLLGTSLIFNVLMGSLGGAAIFAIARPLAMHWLVIPAGLRTDAVVAFRIAGVGFFVSALGWWGASILAGAQRYGWLAAIVAVTATVAAAGSIAAVELHFGVVGVAIANVFSAMLAAVLYGWCAHHVLRTVVSSMSYDSAMLRRVLSYGVFSTLHVVFGVVTTQLDRTLLGLWVGVAAVAIYSVPLSIASKVHQLCAKALEVVLPLASGSRIDGRYELGDRLLLRAQNANCFLVLIIAVPLLVLAPDILRVWIGPEFALKASTIFRCLIVAYGVLALNVAASNIVAGFGNPEVNAAFAFGLGAVNAVGYVALIPRWGALGAAIASAIGSAIAVPPFLWYVRRRFFHVRWSVILRRAVIRPFVSAAVTALLTVVMRQWITGLVSLALVVTCSCSVYLALTAALGVWHPAEVPLLNRLWAAAQYRST